MNVKPVSGFFLKKIFLFILFFYSFFSLSAEEFYYKHRTGDQYRILSTVTQDVYINNRLSHRAEIINRIAVEVPSVEGDSGNIRAVFHTAEAAVGNNANFHWSREYVSEFRRDRLGYLSIDSRLYMPVVRDVPVFPNRDLKPGDTWAADGYEVYDFRDSFGIAEPYRIPFTAFYHYLGEREWNGKMYPAFSVTYNILYNAPAVRGRVWPSRIQGSTDQIFFWDSELGLSPVSEGTFRMIITLSDGNTAEYRSRSFSYIIDAPVMDKQTIADEVLESIERLEIPGATVRIEEAGVTISIENIQFPANSSLLLSEEKLKIDKLIEILLHYPERDILVSGHTALAGTREMRDQLSLERAQSVANYLMERNVRTPERVMVQGFGADRPVADNNTEAGMQRNRRVEITILEN